MEYTVLCTRTASDIQYFHSNLYIVCFESEVKNSDPSESAENRHPRKSKHSTNANKPTVDERNLVRTICGYFCTRIFYF